jgi:hypothetical protein
MINRTPAEMDQPRQALIAGLRELADWYEQHPDAALPMYPSMLVCVHATDDGDGLYEVERMAGILGVKPQYSVGQQVAAERAFGSLELRVYYNTRDTMAAYNARQRIAEAATPAQLAAAGYTPERAS